MNSVSDNGDTFNIRDIYGLIYSTFNWEQFCFSRSDVKYTINYFS